MRIFKIGAAIIALPMAYILSLPSKMADNYIVGQLTDMLSKAMAETFHIRPPQLAWVVSKAWLGLPYLCVASIFYLYHSYYVASVIRTNSPVILKQSRSFKRSVATGLSIIAVTSFSGAMMWVSYQYQPPASASLRYSALSLVSNYELRERAFSVERKLVALQHEYLVQQRKVNEPHDKALVEWNKTSEDYKKRIADYNDRSNPLSPSRFLTLGKQETPSLSSSQLATIGTGSSLGTLNGPTLGQLTPSSPYTTGLLIQSLSPPAPPPPMPEPPLVKVDSGWKNALIEVQQEASAVWEEISHRSGGYPPMFTIPVTYNYPWPAEGDLAEQAARLEKLANSLH